MDCDLWLVTCDSCAQLVSGLPVPKPKAGEVLVRVQAATVNPVDWKLQKGIARPFLPPTMPCIPGTPAPHPGTADVRFSTVICCVTVLWSARSHVLSQSCDTQPQADTRDTFPDSVLVCVRMNLNRAPTPTTPEAHLETSPCDTGGNLFCLSTDLWKACTEGGGGHTNSFQPHSTHP